MHSERSNENLYISLLLPLAAGAFAWSAYRFPFHNVDWQLAVLTAITVCFSSFLRIQLPRTKIHVTTSDVAIILSFLYYGGEVAIVLAVLEAGYTSISYRLRGGTIKNKTIIVNALNAAIAVFFSAIVVKSIFGPPPEVLASGDLTRFIWLLVTMAVSLFLFNSSFVSLFIAAKNPGKSVLKVWSEYCLNALVIYLTSAILAGVMLKAFQQINLMLLGAVALFFAVVYFTYRRYINDIKDTSAKAEQAERERAEQAEVHVKELQHYVKKLEQRGEEIKESHSRLHHAAFHDGLTGLPNKNYFIDAIRNLLKDCRKSKGRPFALLYLDLNRFKTINDSVGHTRGDRLIKNVASRLRETVGENATIGRFSGDEFAILLHDVKSERDVITIAGDVADALAQPFSLFGREVYTSACIGITFGSRTYKRAENILRDADIAMYHAKDSGQKYVVFDEQMHAKAVNLMQLETDLRGAIERSEFEVFYQPVVDLSSLRLGGFEALVRWNHPERGMIPPSEFIGISEATDLIVPLTINILENSCSQVSKWHATDAGKDLFISVNLSGKHFAHPDLVKHVRDVIEKTNFDPAKLKLEITETALMENATAAVDMLRSIRELGVQISLDDFGTGYSSLNYLHRFPIDTLKIDRSFVNSLERSSENSEIVRTIIYLAKALGLSVVAEGIESIRQLSQLQVLSCEFGQGYLFSRPLPASEMEILLIEDFHWRGLLKGVNPETVFMNQPAGLDAGLVG